jgi:hypothetical protein
MKIQRQYRAYLARKFQEAQNRIKAEAEMRLLMARQERIDRMNDRLAEAKTLDGRTKALVTSIGDRFTVKSNKVIHFTKKRERQRERQIVFFIHLYRFVIEYEFDICVLS